ncbi:restriction endonuclease subunit S [Stutzerimonas kunmingensis]|uniref:restriction endonuclease subunit S n=1 Tax=Stutzerimonas kunmingensis TaxID=1211807 RepID=UPI0037D265BF
MNVSVDRRGSLRWPQFSKIKVPVPPLPEQQKIVAILTAVDDKWTCPYKTGHQLPVKLMLLPSA